MDFPQQTSIVNLNKVKYMMMDRLSEILTNNNAIIFGGFVRDRFIHDHFAMKFIAKFGHSDEQMENFDDEFFDLETKGRLIVPKDIDLFIEGDESDVEKLYEVLRGEGFRVSTRNIKKQYFENKNVSQQKATVRVLNAHKMGLPNIEIELDVLFSSEDDLRPPFGRLDLLCNAFLMKHNGIRLSTQTGTYLDRVNPLQQKQCEFEILEKMLRFETDVADLDEGVEIHSLKSDEQKKDIRNRVIRFNRMILMQERGWKINNNVYSLVNKPKDEVCNICEAPFILDQVVQLNCCNLYLHQQCFNDHIKIEYETKVTPQCGIVRCKNPDWIF